MTRNETVKILSRLREYYPNGPEATIETIEAWYEILKPYGYEETDKAVLEVCREWTGYTMPTPAAIIQKAERIREQSAQEQIRKHAKEVDERRARAKDGYNCRHCKDTGIVIFVDLETGNEYGQPCTWCNMGAYNRK